jgi:hypothetical protein
MSTIKTSPISVAQLVNQTYQTPVSQYNYPRQSGKIVPGDVEYKLVSLTDVGIGIFLVPLKSNAKFVQAFVNDYNKPIFIRTLGDKNLYYILGKPF